MTFVQLLEAVITKTYDLYCPLKVDLEDGTIYRDVKGVVVDRGFIILKLRKEKKKK